MMERSLTLLGVVGDNHVEIQQRNVLLGSSFHDTDTPVDIGRIAIALVVGCGDGKVCAGIKSLMADEHTLTEGFPCEVLWGSKTTMVEETAIAIDDIRIAIEHGGEVTLGTVPL